MPPSPASSTLSLSFSQAAPLLPSVASLPLEKKKRKTMKNAARAASLLLLLSVSASLLLAAAQAPAPAPAPSNASSARTTVTKRTDQFHSVRIETPFNVRIEPGRSHSITLEADQSVVSALWFDVTDGELVVTTDATFSSRGPIRLTVQAPSHALSGIHVDSKRAVVAVADGFRASGYVSLTAGGNSKLIVHGMRAPATIVEAFGSATVTLEGDFGDLDVRAVDAAVVNGNIRAKKIAYAGDGAAVLDVASDAQPQVSSEGAGGSTRVLSGSAAKKDRALWDADWTCGLEVTSTSGELLSARATPDSKFTRGSDCEGISGDGSGGKASCVAVLPCESKAKGDLPMLRVK